MKRLASPCCGTGSRPWHNTGHGRPSFADTASCFRNSVVVACGAYGGHHRLDYSGDSNSPGGRRGVLFRALQAVRRGSGLSLPLSGVQTQTALSCTAGRPSGHVRPLPGTANVSGHLARRSLRRPGAPTGSATGSSLSTGSAAGTGISASSDKDGSVASDMPSGQM